MEEKLRRRVAAVKTADAINAMGGVPVSGYAEELSQKWMQGEITGEQMKQELLACHKTLIAAKRSEQP